MLTRSASLGILFAIFFLVTHGVAHSVPMEGSDTATEQADGLGNLMISDLNIDGVVDGQDFFIFRGCYLEVGSECATSDIDGDLIVDLADFGHFALAFAGGAVVVPEPGTLLLVAAGFALIAVGRRRWRA